MTTPLEIVAAALKRIDEMACLDGPRKGYGEDSPDPLNHCGPELAADARAGLAALEEHAKEQAAFEDLLLSHGRQISSAEETIELLGSLLCSIAWDSQLLYGQIGTIEIPGNVFRERGLSVAYHAFETFGIAAEWNIQALDTWGTFMCALAFDMARELGFKPIDQRWVTYDLPSVERRYSEELGRMLDQMVDLQLENAGLRKSLLEAIRRNVAEKGTAP